jgi:TolA-binding protein
VSSCRQARDAIIAVVRQQATEAETLRLDMHLGLCAGCRSEKARWHLMEQLRDQAPQRLGEAARGRVLGNIMMCSPAGVETRATSRRRLANPFLLTTMAVATVALVLAVRGWKPSATAPSLAMDRHGVAVPAATQPALAVMDQTDQTIRARAAGTLETSGARIAYRAGSSFRMLEHGRRIELYAGEVDVEVAPGGPGRFRVVAPRFIVEVIGTRFIVRPTGVETIHGTVLIVDAAGRRLAVLHATESWNVEQAGQLPRALAEDGFLPTAAPEGSARALAPALAMQDSASSSDRRQVDGVTKQPGKNRVDLLIAEARSALASGDPALARTRIASALGARPTGHQRAVADLLAAASFLVEGRYEEALAAYRRTAESFGRYPESETAAFAIAQLLCERASTDEARTALQAYIVRYPEGRFVQDARRKLASLP